MTDLPPSDIAVEQRLLGNLLANNRHLSRLPWLCPEHFADPLHGLIFAVIEERIAASEPADAVVLRDLFAGKPVLEEVGGAKYLAQLLMAAGGDADTSMESAHRIVGTWERRQLILWGEKLREAGIPPP
jgi:replicative DNA helicase